ELYQPDIGGTEESYVAGGSAEMKEGRFFTDTENQHHLPVVAIGADVPRALMNGEDPIGKWIDVNGHKFEIIGVMLRPAASFPGQDDKRLLMPYFTMHKMFPAARENMLVVAAKPGKLPAAIDEVRVVMRFKRHVPPRKPDNFF